MNIQKQRAIIKSHATSRFGHCPLIYMFHSRLLYNKINSIRKRALWITYPDNTSTFQKLLNKDSPVLVHYRKSEVLEMEAFVSQVCLQNF